MAWKKRQYIEQAFESIGLASYVYDLQPEQWQSALSTLDRMMMLWNTKGMRAGYPLPSGPDSSRLGDVCEVPDIASAAIVPNLAMLLCNSFGKVPPAGLADHARETRKALSAYCTPAQDIPWGQSIPAGAGNGWDRTSIYLPQEDPIATGSDSNLGIE